MRLGGRNESGVWDGFCFGIKMSVDVAYWSLGLDLFCRYEMLC